MGSSCFQLQCESENNFHWYLKCSKVRESMLTNIDYIRKSRVTHSDRYSQCYYNYPEILTCCIERVSDEKMAFITWLYMYMQCYAIYDVYNESVPFFYIYERKFIHMYIDYLNPSNRLFD